MALKNVDDTKRSGVNGIWAWAGLAPFEAKKKETKEDSESDTHKGEMPAVDPNKLNPDERAAIEVLNENPMMTASVFYNQLKSKGFKIVAPEGKKPMDQQTQADSATSQPVGVLIGQKSMPQKQSQIKDKFLKVKFREGVKADSLTGPSKFRTVLIQEGMGNLKDGFFYTKEALQSAVPVFEGAKIYADHPDKLEEQVRPERSVRDVLGHFENVHLEEGEDGQSELVGDVCVLKDEPYKWARSLMTHAVEYSNKYPDRDFIGLSINASGDANPIEAKKLLESELSLPVKQKIEKAIAEGVETVRIVTSIKDAVSCDLVTEAGAGGKVLELLEGEKKSMKHESEEKKKETKVDPEHGFEKDAAPAAEPHADEEQDIELIKKMIAKHMGQDGEQKEAGEPDADDKDKHHAMDPEMEEAAMHAYEFLKKEGMDAGEAAKHAAMHVKCAKAYAEKKHEAMKHAESEEGKKHESEEKHEKKESEEKKKESEVARLAGRVAFLEGQIKKVEIEKTIEKTLKESKLPMSATKAFKESIGDIKSIEEFNRLFKVFKEAYKAGGETSPTMLDLSIEKTSRYTESSEGGKAETLGFGDCVK